MAAPNGVAPTGIGVPGVFVAVLIGVTVPLKFVTYAKDWSPLTATPNPGLSGIGPKAAVLVGVSMIDKSPLPLLGT
jgi:hypothetical protein